MRLLRAFLFLGAINTVTGAQPINPGSIGPLGEVVGPLPAMQMPGEIAKTIPTMANFLWLLQALQQGTFATIEDETHVLLASRKLVAGSNITFVDDFDTVGLGNHATLTINGAPGSADLTILDEGVALPTFASSIDFVGGGVTASGNTAAKTVKVPGLFFGINPPTPGTELDYSFWWNSEEGALKVWYIDATPTSQWVDAMPARTGPPGTPGSVSPLTTKGDLWGFSTVDARIPVGADGEVLTGDSTDPLGVSWQALPSPAPDTATYVTMSAAAGLPNERILTAGANITITDGGPGAAVTIAASGGGGGAGTVVAGICCGRATLQSGVAVPVTDQTAKTNLYWTPYKGDRIALYDSVTSAWVYAQFTEITLAVGTLAAAFQAYDVFGVYTAGTLALEFLEWNNGTITVTIASPGVVTDTGHTKVLGDPVVFTTTGALPTGLTVNTTYYVHSPAANTYQLSLLPGSGTAINTSGSQSGVHTMHSPTSRQTALATQDGVLIKSGDATRRWLATVLSSATTTLEDSLAKRWLFNYYNQVERNLSGALESTASWTYSTATNRQANAAVANQCDIVIGDPGLLVEVECWASASQSGAIQVVRNGIGVNSTTVDSSRLRGQQYSISTNATMMQAIYTGYPGIGRKLLLWQERGSGTITTTWYGHFTTGNNEIQMGIWGSALI